jgi:hypothetical protein
MSNMNRPTNSAPSPSQGVTYQNINQRPLSSTGSHNNLNQTNNSKGPIIMRNMEKSQVCVFKKINYILFFLPIVLFS